MNCKYGFIKSTQSLNPRHSAKYPLSLLAKLWKTFPNLRYIIAYDIGCSFKKTVGRNPSLEPLANLTTWTIPAMHGYAHNRLCQLGHHPKYLDGTGLEDFETCERFFSSSNHCARTSRHSTRFHRHQIIDNFLTQWDEERFLNLGSFIYNNYRQALAVVAEYEDFLPRAFAKCTPPLDPATFPQWIEEEREFLTGLAKEPEMDTLRVEYVEALQILATLQEKVKGKQTRTRANPEKRTITLTQKEASSAIMAQLDVVFDLEAQLNILEKERWEPGEQAYDDTVKFIKERHYNRCLDQLCHLLIQRLFELQKTQLESTGYKLRRHIIKALKRRGLTIRTALNAYNKAAREISPPRPTVTFKEIINYAWLAHFDLLRVSRNNINDKQWTQPHVRVLMDQWYKLQRAHEEIKRLNVEIKRLQTWLRDDADAWEEALANDDLKTTFPGLWADMRQRAQRQGAIRAYVQVWIDKSYRLPSFSGERRAYGWSLEMERSGRSPPDVNATEPTASSSLAPQDEPLAADEDPDMDQEAANDALDRMDRVLGQIAL